MPKHNTKIKNDNCKMIYDPYNRPIYYLRISVTDRCNLKCLYCKPERIKKLPHAEILRYEEIIHIVRIAVSMGFYKFRLTGGEPLVRNNIKLLIERISKIDGIKDLSITTNGTLLAEMAKDLYDAGLRRINISLDTLNREKYKYITGVDAFLRVWNGIKTALEVGFSPVRINVVLLKGFNDDEIVDLAKLIFDYPIHIRFIEYMPISPQTLDHSKHFLPVDIVKEKLVKLGKINEISPSPSDGPARRYKITGCLGEIGLISAMSNPFCHSCNRIRLTSDGKIRPCLFSQRQWDIKVPLRSGASSEFIKSIIREAIAHKPRGHNYIKIPNRLPMSRIGG